MSDEQNPKDWATLRPKIKDAITDARGMLEQAPDEREMFRIQGQITAYREVLAMAEPPRKPEAKNPGYD